jgi:hypothetical protein
MNIDSYRASLIGLILASLLMLLLIGWFFFARVGLYEISQEVNIDEQGRLMASFAPEVIERIRPGQPAVLRYYSPSNQPPLTIRATVFDTPPGSNQAEILVMEEELSKLPLAEGGRGQVEVEVDSLSPFSLVMRASGKYVGGGPPVSTAPPQPVEASP